VSSSSREQSSKQPDIAIPAYFLVFLAALIASGPFSMDAYLPAMPIMASYFSVDIVAINNTISTFLIGYALGQVIAGPVSDQIGRKPIGYVGLCIFILSSIGIGLASSVEQVLVLRFVQAIGAGTANVIAMPAVRDVYSAREAGRKFALMVMIMMLAPLVAPALGSVLLTINWQAIFYFLAIYAFVLLVFFFFVMPETRPVKNKKISFPEIFSQYYQVITHKVDDSHVSMRYALAMALSGGLMMTFLTNASFVYIIYFDISEFEFPLYFAGMPIGFMVANMICMRLLKTHNPLLIYKYSHGAQLFSLIVLSVLVLKGNISLTVFYVLLIMVLSMGGITNPSGNTMYMSYFKRHSGSAASLVSTLMFTLGAALGALSGVFFDGTLNPVIITMLAASIMANIIVFSIPHAEFEDRD
jgi:DHA1 family bicyclomycin/chloramphenicol resistance-like MFS transporter